MSNKSTKKIILAALLIIIGFSVIGYFVMLNPDSPQSINQVVDTEEDASLYNNLEQGVSFEYPKDWEVTTQTENIINNPQEALTNPSKLIKTELTKFNVTPPATLAEDLGYEIRVSRFSPPYTKTIEEFVSSIACDPSKTQARTNDEISDNNNYYQYFCALSQKTYATSSFVKDGDVIEIRYTVNDADTSIEKAMNLKSYKKLLTSFTYTNNR